jgi:hypothetical protein
VRREQEHTGEGHPNSEAPGSGLERRRWLRRLFMRD